MVVLLIEENGVLRGYTEEKQNYDATECETRKTNTNENREQKTWLYKEWICNNKSISYEWMYKSSNA